MSSRTAVAGGAGGALVAVLIAGCGRLQFDEVSAGGDGGTDAGLGVDCWAGWRDHTVVLGAPARIDELATGGDDVNPFLTADGQTLYFGRGSSGARDVFMAHRDAPGAPFGPSEAVVSLSSVADDGRVTLTADQLTAIVASDRGGTWDLWLATRATSSVAFGALEQSALVQVNTALSDYDPDVSGDGLILMFAPTGTSQHVMEARRSGVGQPFGPPTQLTELDVLLSPSDPALSPDGRVLLFKASAAPATDEIYYATRADLATPFDAPITLTALNTATAERDVAVSANGCEVFFSSARAGNLDLYHAMVLR